MDSSSLQKFRPLPIFMSVLAATLYTGLVVEGNNNSRNEVDFTWGEGRAKVANSGEQLTLSVDQGSGSGFQSKDMYLFGKIGKQIKLLLCNNLSYAIKEPYLVHTNVYTQGQGNREQAYLEE